MHVIAHTHDDPGWTKTVDQYYLDEVIAILNNTIDALKALPTADGHDDILIPGEPEHRTFDDRSTNGIPLPPGTVKKIQEAARRLELTSPV